MSEYSYFRAEGRSLAAIHQTMEAQTQVEEIKKKTADKYGAETWGGWGWRGRNGTVNLGAFIYRSEDKVPENFDIKTIQKTPEGIVQYINAYPKPGTIDAFGLASLVGLLEKKIKCTRLEGVFDCGEMPMKEVPAGEYLGNFVRDCLLKEKSVLGNRGSIGDETTSIFYSSQPMKLSDPLSCMQLAGYWFIRVPNDETGKPVFTPPDGVLMKYAEMLLLDEAECARQKNRPKGLVPKP